MNIQLSEHFTYKKLIRFTLPSILMMIFTSIYGVVDGFFVSNFAGKTEFAAVNFIMPYLMILGSIGFLFGTGGSALIAKILGEGDRERGNKVFSLIVYTSIIVSIIISIIGIVFLTPVAKWLGAEGKLLDDCILYGTIILLVLPAFVLQMEFMSFFPAAQKPQLGLIVTVIAGVTNMILDGILVGILPFGLKGAAFATAISQVVGGVIPLIYFARKNTSLLKLTKTSMDVRALIRVSTNGSSEFLTNISLSVVCMLYNFQLMKIAGENGIVAYGVLMYVNYIFVSVFIGYSVGSAPIISYNFGSGNKGELNNMVKKSLVIIGVLSVAMFISSELLAKPMSIIYVGYDKELLNLTLRGFLIYSFSFFFTGIAIYGSAFFTALNDGLTSALLSTIRMAVFQVVTVLVIPIFLKIDGIWLSIVVAELLSALLNLIVMYKLRRKYGY